VIVRLLEFPSPATLDDTTSRAGSYINMIIGKAVNKSSKKYSPTFEDQQKLTTDEIIIETSIVNKIQTIIEYVNANCLRSFKLRLVMDETEQDVAL
jgi:hypothetical protein